MTRVTALDRHDCQCATRCWPSPSSNFRIRLTADHTRVGKLLRVLLPGPSLVGRRYCSWSSKLERLNGRCEIGPRALGNRSILAAPFEAGTRERLNAIKQREQFRPIAPVCLEVDAGTWFGCHSPSPFMLYTYRTTTDALAAVTHVNQTARLQTVSALTNRPLFELLTEFKKLTGYGVLCNTSLNFKNKGFINTISDLSAYTVDHQLDGFVVEGRIYMRKSSSRYQQYLRDFGPLAGLRNIA